MVDSHADPAAAAAGRPPVGSEIVPYAPGEGNGAAFEVLRREVMINGEQLIDAQQSFDPQSHLPVVTLRFDSGGSATFARVTSQNVGKRFAMVLDGQVLSAPSRSEEHTSEIQSLLRISYAVFCLVKKQSTTYVTHTYI